MISILTSIVAAVASGLVFLFSIKIIKEDSIYQLNHNIKVLNKLITKKIFIGEVIDGLYWGITFSSTKENILKKYNLIYSTISKMVLLYDQDNKVLNFYNTEVSKLATIIADIENSIEKSSSLENMGLELDEEGKLFFTKLNNKLNTFITTFIIENTKLFSNLKQYKEKNKKNLTYEQYKMKRNFVNFLKGVGSFLLAIAAGVIINYISKILGVL